VAKGASCGAALVCDGAGACVGCTAPSECPGADTECQTRTCQLNKCGFSNAALGAPVAGQTAGNCMKNQCDGAGAIAAVIDTTDLPNDGKMCTNDVCTAGVPSNPPLAVGSACNQAGGTVCNGAGACVQCVTASTCPGADTACGIRTCVANMCGVSNAAAGTAIAAQTAGDCQKNQCDGAGNIVSAPDNTDTPNDGKQCTLDSCTLGIPSNPPLASGSTCAQMGGTVCNGAGACVQCITASTCPGADTACRTRTCVANTCGVSFTPNGTPTPSQVPGDCRTMKCDGAGNVQNAVDVADVPSDDGNQCTDEACMGGTPAHPPKLINSPCAQGLGTVCNGTSLCVQCNTASNCSGTDTECRTRTCMANTCGVSNMPNGTACMAGGTLCQAGVCVP
jgi:hypothetical protein